MNSFLKIHQWIEQTFWYTLTRKLTSILLLFLINLGYLAIYFGVRHDVHRSLQSHGVAAAAIRSAMSDFASGLWLMLALTGFALAWFLLQIAYLRHLIVRPVNNITHIFDELGKGEGDFSCDLPLLTHDEFRQLAQSYNRFADKMRQIIGEVRKGSVAIARDAVRVKVHLDDTLSSVRQQEEMTEVVFNSSAETIKAIDEVSRSTQVISGSTSTNLGNARGSLSEMQSITERINSVGEKVLRFNHTVEDLSRRSESVNQFASLIREVADQTNLLALNAAIEAARAGEAGRGFAVVADEVRKLSERVNNATSEISGNVAAMQAQVNNTRAENEVINADVQHTRAVVERSAAQFRMMVGDFEQTGEQLLHIAAAMEELSVTNAQVHDNVKRIHELSAKVASHMEASTQATAGLTQSTEEIQERVSLFKIGQGTFDDVVGKSRLFRDKLRAELAEMVRSGQNIFDRNYVPFGNNKPQKYRVSWGEEYARRCQGLLDECYGSIPGCAYAVGVNTDGYLSSHNAKFSRPLTGDEAADLVGNRCCRKFDNPGELRAAHNNKPMLLRTYLRDTGEILCDIAMPIEIDGRLWGNARIGVSAAALQDAR